VVTNKFFFHYGTFFLYRMKPGIDPIAGNVGASLVAAEMGLSVFQGMPEELAVTL
jgi:hypothetical protein